MRIFALLGLVVVAPSLHGAEPAPTPNHDRAFWQKIVDNDAKLPDGESAAALVRELSQYLGSPDPTLRDTYAYSLSEAWIYRDQKLSPAELRERLGAWSGNLKSGLGEQGTDAVLLRSFSALELSLLAAYDLKAPYLGKAEFDALLAAALEYFAAERDVRGYDPQKGWMHSVAHTADLLKFLARNPHLAPADQGRILSAIGEKIAATGPLTHGEDERLARAVLSLVRRSDFDAAAFRAWHGAYPAQQKALWSNTPLDTARYAGLLNAKHLMVSLYTLLAQVKEPAPATVTAREELLATLGQL
jgi:hypothetical protein